MKKFIAIFLLLAAFVFPSASFSEDVINIKAEGMALKSSDLMEVKRKAIDDALKNAVSEALKTIIKKEGLAVEPSLPAAPPRSYVLNYRILSEGLITHMDSTPPVSDPLQDGAQVAAGVEVYHIWIDASVDAAQLRAAIGHMSGDGALAATINILDVSDYAAFRSIKTALERIAVLKDVSYGSFSRGRVVLTALSSVDMQALSERIFRELESRYAVMPSDNGVIIRPVPKEIGE